MKKKRSTNRQLMGLGLGAIMSLGGPPVSLAEDSSGFVEKMKKWQSEMSEKFRDTYKSLRGESQKREKSGATASVDLREQNESYTVRLNLPSRDLDKVEVKLEGDDLRIVAPAEEKVGRYEQTVRLSDVPPDAKLVIDRRALGPKAEQRNAVVSLAANEDEVVFRRQRCGGDPWCG